MAIDVHHHIIELENPKSIYNTYRVEDLDSLDRVKAGFINIGIHPMYIPESSFKSIPWSRIEELLKSNRFNIGEVGLDRRGDLTRQLEVFNKFLKLGEHYNKSVSIHCVKRWGALLESIGAYPGLKYLFHGYSGSVEVLNSLTKFNSYFSISLREVNRASMASVIKAVPVERILIESDLSTLDRLEEVDITVEKISKLRSITVDKFNSIISDNFNEFIK